MKQVRHLLPLLFAVLTLSVFGQTIDFDKVETRDPNAPFFKEPQDYRTLGIDVGVSYQTSDVRPVWGGWGIGLTYEKNMVHEEGGAFDLGIRGRLMYANSRGYDNRATVGVRDNPVPAYKSDASYFANFLTHQAELAGEGVITFNKLREKTGIYATLFGGIGIVGYDVRLDQLNGNGAKYDYKSLGATPTVADVRSFHDGDFETSRLGGDTLTGTGFMPSVGAEIGFQVSPKFMIVLGHKWMFTQTDLFDGKEYINNVDKGVRKDFHQYTHIQLKWILGKRKPKQEYPKQEYPRQQQPPTTTYPTQTTPTQTTPAQTNPTVKLPIVRFIAPNSNLETERERLPIVVKIDHVSDYPSVNLTINGRDNRDFALRNGELTSDILLQEGKNTVNVWARNAAGSSSDNVTITLRRSGTTTPPTTTTPTTTTPTTTTPTTTTTVRPSVQINSIGNVTNDNFGGCKSSIEARVDNVNNRNDIRLTINGRNVSNFNFDNSTKILRGSLSLASGSNRIIITAKNEAGNSSDERTISCVMEQPRTLAPTVQILSPSNNARVSENTVNVEARVSNVVDRNGVKVYINGAEDRSFTFDANSQIVRTTANVRAGQNTIVVRAQNETSNVEGRVNVSKRAIIVPPPPPPVVKTPPTVVITNPASGSRTTNPSVNLVANAENVVESQVSVLLNGQAVPFTLSGRQIQATLNLPRGENTVTVRAENNDGTAEKSISITYDKKKQLPDSPTAGDKIPTEIGTDTELPAPTIANFNATQPVIDPFDPKPAVSAVTATIGNVQNAGQIELYVNGAQQTSFTYNPETQQILWTFQPKGGMSYTFNIVAKNATGRTSKTEVVKF